MMAMTMVVLVLAATSASAGSQDVRLSTRLRAFRGLNLGLATTAGQTAADQAPPIARVARLAEGERSRGSALLPRASVPGSSRPGDADHGAGQVEYQQVLRSQPGVAAPIVLLSIAAVLFLGGATAGVGYAVTGGGSGWDALTLYIALGGAGGALILAGVSVLLLVLRGSATAQMAELEAFYGPSVREPLPAGLDPTSLPRRSRPVPPALKAANVSVQVGAHVGLLAIDGQLNHFYGLVAGNFGIPLLTEGNQGATLLGMGYTFPLSDPRASMWFMDLMGLVAPNWYRDWRAPDGRRAVVGLGAGVGWRYLHRSGFTLGLRLPVFGATIGGPQDLKWSIERFFIASAIALPIVSAGYRFDF